MILLIGANPRHEATILNARIKKRTRKPGCVVASIGDIPYQTYPVQLLGNDVTVLQEIFDGKHEFCAKLKAAKNPMLIVGESTLTRGDGAKMLALAHAVAGKYSVLRADWGGMNILHKAASRVGALDLGIVPGKDGRATSAQFAALLDGGMEVLFLLGADNVPSALETRPTNTCIIYLGHHCDKAAHLADIILPGAAYTEKNATYVNLEGRVQRGYRAVSAPGKAQEDWQILAAIAKQLELSTNFASLTEVRDYIAKHVPHLAVVDNISPIEFSPYVYNGAGKLLKTELTAFVDNYYMTDPISRHSPTMARCTQEIWQSNSAIENVA